MSVHVVPLNDLRDHVESGDCWCSPVEDDDYADLWVHNSMDRREETIEKGVVQ